jgi:hypothetical protein
MLYGRQRIAKGYVFVKKKTTRYALAPIRTAIAMVKCNFSLRQGFVSMMNRAQILEFGLRLMLLDNSQSLNRTQLRSALLILSMSLFPAKWIWIQEPFFWEW